MGTDKNIKLHIVTDIKQNYVNNGKFIDNVKIMADETICDNSNDAIMEQPVKKDPDGEESSIEMSKENNGDNTAVEDTESIKQKGEPLNFKMVWNKKNYEVNVLGTLNSVGSMRTYRRVNRYSLQDAKNYV